MIDENNADPEYTHDDITGTKSLFQDLMEDTVTYRWEVMCHFFELVLKQTEQGHMAWRDREKIECLRCLHTWNKPNTQIMQPRYMYPKSVLITCTSELG